MCQVLDKFGVYFVLVQLVISPMSFLVKIPLYERILSTASMWCQARLNTLNGRLCWRLCFVLFFCRQRFPDSFDMAEMMANNMFILFSASFSILFLPVFHSLFFLPSNYTRRFSSERVRELTSSSARQWPSSSFLSVLRLYFFTVAASFWLVVHSLSAVYNWWKAPAANPLRKREIQNLLFFSSTAHTSLTPHLRRQTFAF